jgi:DUF2911 family protein
MSRFGLAPAAFLVSLVAVSSTAFGQALKPTPSGRGTTAVSLTGADRSFSISIDFGQPHARGRMVAGALPADLDTVWRLGANDPTTLRSDVDLVIGTVTVPKGAYTLSAQTSASGAWKLIVNRKTGQEAVPYDAMSDLGRTPLTSRTLATPIESFTIWLIPAADGSAAGEIRFAWGTKEFSAPWKVK